MPTHIALPSLVGRYRLLKKLGAGGMGSVYLGEDTELDRKVAIKIPHFITDDESPEFIRRFMREARAAAGIEHPNLCPVHDAGVSNGIPYLVMPFLEGSPLSELISTEHPWPAVKAIPLAAKIALAVQVLHDRGLVHRDLKPSNVMLMRGGTPVVMDFGLVRSCAAAWEALTEGPESRCDSPALTSEHLSVEDMFRRTRENKASSCITHARDPSQGLTKEGQMIGTPPYMAPEQFMGDLKKISPATDIYALGVLLYELLTGTRPFEGPMPALCMQALGTAPEPPSARQPRLSGSVDKICLKALAKKPEDRYASMAEFAVTLESCSPDIPVANVISRHDLLEVEITNPHDWQSNEREYWRNIGKKIVLYGIPGLVVLFILICGAIAGLRSLFGR